MKDLDFFGYRLNPPERKVPGTLSITDGGGIELKVLGSLGPFYERVERIVGKVEWEGNVTLDDCLCISKESSQGVEESLIRVNMAFTGLAYSEGESPSFDSLIFSVEGIDEWVGISGIMADTEVAKGIKTISFQQPADIAINLENGMCLSITFDCEFPFDGPVFSDDENSISEMYFTTEATISQKTYFKLTSQDVCKLVDFTSVAAKIVSPPKLRICCALALGKSCLLIECGQFQITIALTFIFETSRTPKTSHLSTGISCYLD